MNLLETTAQKKVANGIIKVDTKKSELDDYYAATLVNPAKFILLRAICNSSLTSWPELTTELISKHISKRLADIQGHMDQEYKDIWSIKPVKNDVQELDSIPEQ